MKNLEEIFDVIDAFHGNSRSLLNERKIWKTALAPTEGMCEVYSHDYIKSFQESGIEATLCSTFFHNTVAIRDSDPKSNDFLIFDPTISQFILNKSYFLGHVDGYFKLFQEVEKNTLTYLQDFFREVQCKNVEDYPNALNRSDPYWIGTYFSMSYYYRDIPIFRPIEKPEAMNQENWRKNFSIYNAMFYNAPELLLPFSTTEEALDLIGRRKTDNLKYSL